MSTDAAPPAKRSRVVARLLGIVALVGFGASLVWATAPRRRREVLFEAPIRLRAGETVSGPFTPEHDGSLALELRFREARAPSPSDAEASRGEPLDRVAAAVGGGWRGPPGPPGIAVTYSIRRGSTPTHVGRSDDAFGGWWGAAEVGVRLASVDTCTPETHDVDVRIERADERLTAWDARLVVAALRAERRPRQPEGR